MKKINGFTLAEVLITLVIIGIIASVTLPSIISETKNKEYHSMLKKNFSVISNALKNAQAEEGLLNDNSVIFTPISGSERHYNTAKNLSKYINTVKICKNSSEKGCEDFYYTINYYTEKDGTFDTKNMSAMLLSDGTVFKIYQNVSCNYEYQDCKQDASGNCLYDEEGNKISNTTSIAFCGVVYVDVNGAKAPNKLGEDNFAIRIFKDSVEMGIWGPNGGQVGNNILMNKI